MMEAELVKRQRTWPTATACRAATVMERCLIGESAYGPTTNHFYFFALGLAIRRFLVLTITPNRIASEMASGISATIHATSGPLDLSRPSSDPRSSGHRQQSPRNR